MSINKHTQFLFLVFLFNVLITGCVSTVKVAEWKSQRIKELTSSGTIIETKAGTIEYAISGVGKTVVAAGIVRALTVLGYKTAVMKPIETGCRKEGEMLIPADGMYLKSIAGISGNIHRITPYTFSQPLSPLMAAMLDGRTIELEGIFNAYRMLSKQFDTVVVEGIGGLYVPILKDYFVADLARDIQLPLIIVARPTLGTLNHTMLTIHYALSKGIQIAGLVLNSSSEPKKDIAEKTNHEALKAITDIPIIGRFPYLHVLDEENVDKAALQSFDLDSLRAFLS